MVLSGPKANLEGSYHGHSNSLALQPLLLNFLGQTPLDFTFVFVPALMMAQGKLPSEADHRAAIGHQNDTGQWGVRSQSRQTLLT